MRGASLVVDGAMDGASSEARGTFEWVAGWPSLEAHFKALNLPSSTTHAIDIGCGNSTLPLHLASLYSCVSALDREEHCAVSMRAQHPEAAERVTWRTCDICDAASLASVLDRGTAGLVVDKGTLDCAIVEHDAARLLCNVAWLLEPGGVYAVISFRKPELLIPLLSCPALNWSVEHTPLPMQDGEEPASLCIVRNKSPESADGCNNVPELEAVSEYVNEIVDNWYLEEAPLLTEERKEKLRREWKAALEAERLRRGGVHEPSANGNAEARLLEGKLPLKDAWVIMLTEEERGELSYEEFVVDVDGFVEREPQVLTGEDAMAITLAKAMEYLQEMS